ncbi:hypothetical protein AB9Q10_36420 [Streptomyces krungchingensis]|uniref:hypothetical protein n=1 Tax=Streptomyces krungchingensis TaxID=1565034 RepID=UPI003CEBC0F8
MRALPARRIASTALSATLLLGIAAPAAIAADGDSSRGTSHAAAAPVPGADALLAQVQSLADIGGVLSPVTDLLNTVLKADNGQLTPDQATKLGQAVKDAIAKVTAAAPATPPVALPDTTTPTTTTLPSVTKSTEAKDGKAPAAKAQMDLKGDALTALQAAVDALLKAATSGDPTQVVPAVTAVVTGLVNFVVATVLGGGLPAANLPGLPSLSGVTSTLPTSDVTSTLPTGGLLPTR